MIAVAQGFSMEVHDSNSSKFLSCTFLPHGDCAHDLLCFVTL